MFAYPILAVLAWRWHGKRRPLAPRIWFHRERLEDRTVEIDHLKKIGAVRPDRTAKTPRVLSKLSSA
jgi:hypothetical protein